MSICINQHCKVPNNPNDNFFCQSCGSELLIDGRYRVIKELGQGGFGITYEVLDTNSEHRVLKVLMDNQPKYVELFRQEAEVLGRLNHPCIPFIDPDGYFQYYPLESTETLHCIVMEKVEGIDLSQYIYQRGNRPIKAKRALRWLAELSLILEEVHNQSFFHRDIKPANIMLRLNGSLALIDFGTVRQLTGTYLSKQENSKVTGVISSGYTPMEQMRGKAVQQSDFYALGATMVFLLTAREISQFFNPHKNKLEWYHAAGNIPSRFVDLVNYMLEDLPTNRPQTAREIFEAAISIDPSLEGINQYLQSGASKSSSHQQNQNVLTDSKASSANQKSQIIIDNNSQAESKYISVPSTSSYINNRSDAFNPEDETVFMNRKSNIVVDDSSRIFRAGDNSIGSSYIPQDRPQFNSATDAYPFPIKCEINRDFIDKCSRELSEFMGPIAKKVCQSVLENNPHIIKKKEFIATVSKVIPNAEEIEQFQQRFF